MGFAGSMLSGGSGAGFKAQGVSADQVGAGYTNTQNAITQQQNFVNALGQQNGLANQSSVFNQQQGLANQLQNVANGNGPNPALAQLHQATAANVANQAAMAAGQRGSSANVGLMARQAANQGANIQQQAVGQGATLQAQQQLAAMQQLQNQQASMGNLANTQVNQQQTGLTGLGNMSLQQQANLYGLQGNMNSANAGIANTNAGGQQNMLGNMMGGIGSVGNLFGGKKDTGLNPDGTIPTMDGGFADGTGIGDTISTTDGMGLGDFATEVAAKGGMIGSPSMPKRMAEGGDVEADPLMSAVPNQEVKQLAPTGPQSNVVKTMNIDSSMPQRAAAKGGGNPMSGMMSGLSKIAGPAMKGLQSWGEHEAMPYITDALGSLGSGVGGIGTEVAGGAGDAVSGGGAVLGSAETGTEVAAAGEGIGTAAALAAKGGKVPALLSPDERYLSPAQAKAVAAGKASAMKDGQKVPGTPKVGGAKNSYANDTIPAALDAGGVVVPRSITQAKNPDKKAEAFVKAVLARSGHIPRKA